MRDEGERRDDTTDRATERGQRQPAVLGAYFMRNSEQQDNSLALYERLGRETQRMELTTRQRFHAVSAITGFVVGTAADLGQEPPREVVEGETSREDYLARFADSWRAKDPEEFPFLREIVDEFEDHDDREQFLSGLDLILAGLRLQAGAAPVAPHEG